MAEESHLVGWVGARIKVRTATAPWEKWSKCRQMHEQLRTSTTLTEEQRAAALKQLTDLFFPTRQSNSEQVAAAKSICDSCAVKIDCLAFACVNREPFGIWGGQGEKERRETRAKLRAQHNGVMPGEAGAVKTLDRWYGEK